MKKLLRSYALCWVILIALFNLGCFITPTEWYGFDKFGGTFWAGYVCITFAFVGQLVCAIFALRRENAKRLFYRLPIITVSYTGLVATFLLGTLCMAIPDVPNWVGILVCTAVLAFTAIAVVKASAAAGLVERADEKIETQTRRIKTLAAEAETLLTRTGGEEVKAVCQKVCEALRYSDPMSNPALSIIEEQIAAELDALKAAADDPQSAGTIADRLLLLLQERNAKCKMLK